MINGEMRVKEKVSRPDKTGVWKEDTTLPFNLSRMDLFNGKQAIRFAEMSIDEILDSKNRAANIANQAIEKMIASAREKE